MIFKPYYTFESGCAGYLFGCVGESRCAVVDPRDDDVHAYIQFSESKALVISHVIDTHVHADPLSGGLGLAGEVGAQYSLHESAHVAVPFQALVYNQEIVLGNVTAKVLHTPRASACS